jgi:Zn-dependent protease
MTPQENIFVSLSGPAVNAIIAAFLFCLTTAIDSDMLRFAAYLNAFGAAFNLLPFAPLDGGHVLLARIRMARGRGEDYDDDPVYISTALAGFALFIAANAAFFMAPDWWSPFEPAQGMSAEGENAKGG